MTKIVIIYDSKTGNTENMAKAVADGAKTVSGVDVTLKKIGEPFSLKILEDADALLLGSPAHYGHVTHQIRDFLACLSGLKNFGRIELEGKLGAAFGSYGWDGGLYIEKLVADMKNLGIIFQSPALVQVSLLPYPALKEKAMEKCREFGKTLAEATLKKID